MKKWNEVSRIELEKLEKYWGIDLLGIKGGCRWIGGWILYIEEYKGCMRKLFIFVGWFRGLEIRKLRNEWNK